jgi:hypothetical protein
LILRRLARSFDIPRIRDQLLDIAGRCEEVAKSMEENPQGADLSASEFAPDLH